MANRITVYSPAGASCHFALEVVNLPAGVTSQMPTTMTLRTSGVGWTDLALQAASDAAPGRRDRDVACDPRRPGAHPGPADHHPDEPDLDLLGSSTRSEDTGIQFGVLINTAQNPTVVRLSSSDPEVAQVPESVTIPAGWSSADFLVKALSARGGSSTVTITASLGDASDSLPLTVVRR